MILFSLMIKFSHPFYFLIINIQVISIANKLTVLFFFDFAFKRQCCVFSLSHVVLQLNKQSDALLYTI